jgi:hypothetical protein
MTEPSWGDEDTVRMRPPVDPWAHDGHTQQIPIGRPHRRVYGFVYELITGDPQDGPHPYVGQTTATIHRRVHGPNGHTSPDEIAQAPWKARIRPGREGYRCLKTIYTTGSEVEDQMRLDLAEAILIDELKSTHNEQRPIRPPSARRRSPALADRPRPSATLPARRHARRRPPFRVIAFLLLVTTITYLAARLVVAMELPWPAAPWIVAPVAGLGLGWKIFWETHRRARRLMRPARRRR